MPAIVRPGRPGHIFLPQYGYVASWKITVTDPVSGTVWNITNYIIGDGKITWYSKALAYVNLKLINDDGRWLDLWDGGETVEIWAEYADTITPSNKMFKGKLDSILFSCGSDGYTATIKARQVPELSDIKIITQFYNSTCSDAVKNIVASDYSSYLTTTGVENSATTITTTFNNMAGIQTFSTMVDKSGFDLYIDVDDDVKFFEQESKINLINSIVQGQNLISLNNYGINNSNVYNKISVYGKEENNIILLKTEENTTSQTTLWRKDLIISDSSLISMSDIQDRADMELSNNIKRTAGGNAVCLGMIEIRPGDLIEVSVPYAGATGSHVVSGFTHTFSNSVGFRTSIDLTRRQTSLETLFKEGIDAQRSLIPSINLNSMKNSYTVFFNEDPTLVTHTNTEIVNDKLQLISGQNTGIATFNRLLADENVTQCELRIVTNYPQNQLSSYKVSNDNGVTWETITVGVVHIFNSTGNKLKFKINFVGDATTRPAFDMICVLYK